MELKETKVGELCAWCKKELRRVDLACTECQKSGRKVTILVCGCFKTETMACPYHT